MSNSKRKTPIIPNCGVSDKKGKQKANRSYRKIVHSLLSIGKDDFPLLKEISDIWDFPKDGKSFISNCNPKYLRK